MPKIIRLSKRSLSQLADIDKESEHQEDQKNKFSKAQMRKELIERFRKNEEIFFGFKEDGVLEGYATLKPFFPGYKHCEIYWLAVRKSSQGRGIGTQLMKFVESFAKKKGFRAVFVYTNKKMLKTQKFYKKLGYKLVNEFPGYYGFKKNNTAVLLRKSI
jgi:ribosomal protein S18 acetylase RimI-like enzyme